MRGGISKFRYCSSNEEADFAFTKAEKDSIQSDILRQQHIAHDSIFLPHAHIISEAPQQDNIILVEFSRPVFIRENLAMLYCIRSRHGALDGYIYILRKKEDNWELYLERMCMLG